MKFIKHVLPEKENQKKNMQADSGTYENIIL